MKVLKFGGTSMADAAQYRKIADIVHADPARRVVVVSAAGKRTHDDNKITDLLYLCHAHLQYGVSYEDIFNKIRERYCTIRDELGLKTDLESEFDALHQKMESGISCEELVSRGEYFSARLMADFLGYTFIDATRWLYFRYDGTVDQEKSYAALRDILGDGCAVIPGFYGVMPDGTIRTLTRGGSDITGALAAAAPTIWTHLSDDRRNRILVLFDASIDPDAQNERYQVNRSIRALQNGGIRGQGLYNGTMVQSSSLPMQRNDFIFSAIGEELGMLGCLAVLLLLSAVIIRIIHVGIKSGNYMNRLICVGIAGMMASQILINVGVCLGLVPVIGLTLPFFSYGGSSLITTFLAMGIVSGINMRPAPDVHARYIRPKS